MFPIWSLQGQSGQSGDGQKGVGSGEEDQKSSLDGRKVKRDDGTEPMGNTDRDGGGESRTQDGQNGVGERNQRKEVGGWSGRSGVRGMRGRGGSSERGHRSRAAGDRMRRTRVAPQKASC